MRVCELQEGSCSNPRLLIYVQANGARLGTAMLLEKKKKGSGNTVGLVVLLSKQKEEKESDFSFCFLTPNMTQGFHKLTAQVSGNCK